MASRTINIPATTNLDADELTSGVPEVFDHFPKLIFVNHRVNRTPALHGKRNHRRAFHTGQEANNLFNLLVWRIQQNVLRFLSTMNRFDPEFEALQNFAFFLREIRAGHNDSFRAQNGFHFG